MFTAKHLPRVVQLRARLVLDRNVTTRPAPGSSSSKPCAVRAGAGIRTESRKPILPAFSRPTRCTQPTRVHQFPQISPLLEGEGLREIHTVSRRIHPTRNALFPLRISDNLFSSYPHALHHLELLQHPHFRSEIAKDEWREYLNQKQFDHWRTWLVVHLTRVSALHDYLLHRRDEKPPAVQSHDTTAPVQEQT